MVAKKKRCWFYDAGCWGQCSVGAIKRMHGPQGATISDADDACVLPIWPDILHRVSPGNNSWWLMFVAHQIAEFEKKNSFEKKEIKWDSEVRNHTFLDDTVKLETCRTLNPNTPCMSPHPIFG
jgi:hypothetical protein